MIRCSGCGVVLQTEDKGGLGYVPLEKLEEGALCARCFRLVHYNDLQLVSFSKNEDVLEIVNQSGSYAFFLVDIFNINKEVLSMYERITLPKCLLVSKVDLLLKSLSYEKMRVWLRHVYGVEDSMFLSAVKNYNVKGILRFLEEKGKQEAYLLGFTNAGKSTLLNAFQGGKITTSVVPNTTLDFLRIPLEEGYTLIDTPGFQYANKIYADTDLEIIKKVNGKERLRPIFYPLKKGASVVIEDLVRIENKGEMCYLIFYVPNLLKIIKVYEKNTLLKNYGSISLSFLKNEDLVLKGLGFATCKTKANLNVYVKNKEAIEKRISFFDKE